MSNNFTMEFCRDGRHYFLLDGSFKVLTSVWLTDAEETVVRRGWRERLLSWPWRPWRATKTMSVTVPSKRCYTMADGTLVMHPATLAAMREQLRKNL